MCGQTTFNIQWTFKREALEIITLGVVDSNGEMATMAGGAGMFTMKLTTQEEAEKFGKLIVKNIEEF